MSEIIQNAPLWWWEFLAWLKWTCILWTFISVGFIAYQGASLSLNIDSVYASLVREMPPQAKVK